MARPIKKTHDHAPHHRHTPPDGGDAFLPDVVRNHEKLVDDESEAFAEELIATATSGEFVGEDARDEWTTEEVGGPFLEVGIDEEELSAIRELDASLKKHPTRKAG